jgi:hypothetical protein
MTHNTNNLLVITRDDQLDESYIQAVRKQRITNMLATTGRIVAKTVEYTADKLNELTTPVRLDIADAALGTDLRAEYFQKKREAAIAHLREIVQL